MAPQLPLTFAQGLTSIEGKMWLHANPNAGNRPLLQKSQGPEATRRRVTNPYASSSIWELNSIFALSTFSQALSCVSPCPSQYS